MKRIISIAIVLLTVLMSLASCSKPPELSEIRNDIEALLEASREVNMILFGEGLEVAKQTVDGKEEPITSDYENYYYVAPETGYVAVQQIKDKALEVFSKEYIEPLFDSFFTGRYDAVYGGVVKANYIDSDNGLLKLKNFEPYITGEMRTYDYNSIEIAKPSRKDFVTFKIDSFRNGEKLNITLSIVMTEKGWRLDGPSY